MTKIAPDLEVDLAHLNFAAQDEENRLKEEMQKLLPVVALMRINARPNSLMGLERDQKLSIMVYSRAEIEQMTGFRRESPTAVDLDAEVEIFISGRDFPDELKEFDAGIEAEMEMEWRRWLKHGIDLGFVEGEGGEPKLRIETQS
jgi:hypothetical protein